MRLLLLSVTVACLQLSAQIVLNAGGGAPVTIAAADLAKLPRHTAVLNDHGKQVSYEGVLVRDVLSQGGLDLSKGVRGKQLSTYVAMTASDGYEVVFALAEFDPTLSESGIIVADKREGQALDSHEGPLRVIVPQNAHAARSLRMLHEIDVVQLRK